ncbi:MAG: hypothetical protein M1524_00365 [Patescibacteria group bacterium]|nr:hypothetical protein [Patescibacteria group bacterium]
MPIPESEEVIRQATEIIKREEVGQLTLAQVFRKIPQAITPLQVERLFTRGAELLTSEPINRYPKNEEEYIGFETDPEPHTSGLLRLLRQAEKVSDVIGDEKGAIRYSIGRMVILSNLAREMDG